MAEGGWKSQPLALKLLLPVSLVLVALGVWRCTMELTPVEDPGTIRVESATVEVPDSLSAMPADSLSALTTRMFTRSLASASQALVTREDDPSAWAVVRLRLRESDGGRVELGVVASSTATRRPIGAATRVDSLYRLRDMTEEAARAIAAELDVAGHAGASSTEGR